LQLAEILQARDVFIADFLAFFPSHAKDYARRRRSRNTVLWLFGKIQRNKQPSCRTGLGRDINPLRTLVAAWTMSTVIEIVRGLAAARGKEVPVMGFVYGPLGVLSQIRGHSELFKDIIRHPDRVLEAVNTINESLVECAVAQVEAGAHAIVLDPLYSSASVLRKETWIKFEAEAFSKVADAIRKAGVPVIVHNCGGVYFDAVLEYIKPVAISFAYPAYGSSTWEEHAANWAKKVVTIGVTDPATLGHEFTEEQILEDARRQIEIFKVAEGGFILSTGCEFPPNGSLLSAATLVKAAKLYGRY
jgi:uroporphyrinogen decarboxylase